METLIDFIREGFKMTEMIDWKTSKTKGSYLQQVNQRPGINQKDTCCKMDQSYKVKKEKI